MAKLRQVFVCRSCGGSQSRWMGKCPDCGAWDSLEEHRVDASSLKDPQRGTAQAWAAGASLSDAPDASAAPEARPIADATGDAQPAPRIPTGLAELDRVLGGGLVPASVVLIGGDPGIGKSTLMLQAAGAMAGAEGTSAEGRGPSEKQARERADAGSSLGPRHSALGPPPSILYVSSEESADQVRMRAARLGVASAPNLYVLSDTNLARIVEQTRRLNPRVLVIDSVQMIYKADLDASPGSVAQIRRCCAELVYLAKASGIAVVLVGHVTKEGQLAGPRLLEHLVDAVLYFEGDRYHAHRVLRAVKNRFGTTLEIGVFHMTGAGLEGLPAGPGVGVLGSDAGGKVGAVICPVLTGSRCMLVEIQALTATGFLGAAKRKCSGLDPSRLAMIIAVLEQHAELRLADRDVFVSSVGGIRVAEPASDLALLLAIAGAHFKRSLAPGTAVLGEVGLGGEVRPVAQPDARIAEAARLGFKHILLPALPAGTAKFAVPKSVQLHQVRTIGQAIEHLT